MRAIAAAIRLPRGLRARVLGWTLAVLVAIALPAAGVFIWLVDSTVVKLGTLFAEKQILFDRYRGLDSLMREVSLAETVARSPAILEWAQDEANPAKAERGLAELEHYRLSFKDQSYFTVLDGSGNYYFNDKNNTYEHDRRRYTLSRDNPRDGWYYKTAALGLGLPSQCRPRRQPQGHQGLDQLRHPAWRPRARHHRHRRRPQPVHP